MKCEVACDGLINVGMRLRFESSPRKSERVKRREDSATALTIRASSPADGSHLSHCALLIFQVTCYL
eukprot:274653-Hanusia_phi.AAC.2